jgi:predicted O-methyltransferase YrrM
MHLPWRMMSPDADAAGPQINTSLTENEARKLRSLAWRQRVLEVGSANGFSAVAMGTAGAEVIIAVDPHTWVPGSGPVMANNLSAYGLAGNVQIFYDTFFRQALVFRSTGAKFSLIFIDGDHSYHAIRHDVEQALELLDEHGTLAIHDYMEMCCCPDVQRACNEIFPSGPAEIVDTLAIYKP